jgi:hypothetical protein
VAPAASQSRVARDTLTRFAHGLDLLPELAGMTMRMSGIGFGELPHRFCGNIPAAKSNVARIRGHFRISASAENPRVAGSTPALATAASGKV